MACRSRRERKKGDFDPLLANGILTEGVLALSSRRLAFCRARMCDLRCVMQRRLMYVHPRRLLRSGIHVIRAYICVFVYMLLAHSHPTRCNLAVHVFTTTFRSPGSTVQRQRVKGVMREVQQKLGENASSEGAVE